MTERFEAWRFDGRTGEPERVDVRVESGALLLEHRVPDGSGLASPLRLPLEGVEISEPFDHAPRVVYTASGGTIQVTDGRGFGRALEATGLESSSVAVRMQRRPAGVAAALLALVIGLALGYFRGVPALSRWAADAAPPEVKQRMGDQILAFIDERWFEPSALPAEKREAIARRFDDAAKRFAPGHEPRLVFRRLQADDPESSHDGFNAFSLPNGVIVLLDGVVESGDEDEVFAVLGHELGHLVGSHSLQSLLRAASLGALASLAWGDFSGTAAGIAATLGTLRYSRELETEADDFAVRFLAANGLDARPLCRFFLRILEIEIFTGLDAFPVFFSTHPDTSKRIERLCPDEIRSS